MTSDSTNGNGPVVEVCYGPECSDCGGREIARELKALGLNVVEGDCRDQCPNAPLVLVDDRMITCATAQKVQDWIGTLQA